MTGPTSDRSDAVARPEWEALARYLAGESPDEERDRVRAWLGANRDDHKVLEALDRMLEGVPADLPEGLDVEAALRKTHLAAGVGNVLEFKRGSRTPLPARLWWQSPALRVAAVLGVAAVGSVLWRYRDQAREQELAGQTQTYHATLGKPDSVDLSDGSRAILAPGSELVVSADYGRRLREVRLTGQGWFRVVHNDGLPFVVRTAGAEVRDVGTEFTVNEGANGRVRVSVHEGAVLVRGSTQDERGGVLLHQGDEATVEQGVVASTVRGSVAPDAADWASGTLHFRDVPLSEVAATLKRWYGLELRITDASLAAKQITIDVNAGAIDGVPQELALAVGGEVLKRGDTTIVRPLGGRR